MSSVAGICWKCRASLSASDYGRGDVCPKCRNDTRVCRNCIHYDPNYNNSCLENQAERVVDKERSNFCDYFSASSKTDQNDGDSRASALSAAEALFKKKN